MKKLHTVLSFVLGFWLLSACGFKPMYGENGASPALQDTFSRIQIAPIPERTGQVIRNHLLDSINPYGGSGAPDYILSVVLEQAIEAYGFRSDESTTRESLTLEAMFQLVNTETGDVVFEDLVRSVQSYDIVQSDFANFSTRQDAEARTALQVSDLITARLGMFFKSRP